MKKAKDYVQVSIYLPHKLHKALEKEARKLTIPLAALIRQKLGVGE